MLYLRFFLAAAVAFSVSMPAAAAQAVSKSDARRGEQVYARCLACHSLQDSTVGPKHCGLFGRRAGSVGGYDYSPAMRRSGIVWNERTLDRFLADPLKTMPGTSMTYAGVPDTAERAALIAFLKQASTSAACRQSLSSRARP
jgi:cytochrome c